MKMHQVPGTVSIGLALLVGLFLSSVRANAADARPASVRVLVIYGGHDFETNQFLRVFEENGDITFKTAVYPQAQALFKAEAARDYDVLVFYDMWPELSEEAKADLTNRLREGKGLLAMHHCLASFQKWDEYRNIIGGRYHTQKWTDHGVEKPGSTYQHDVDFKVNVADPDHFITRGVKDFTIHDEVYGGFEVLPEVHVLLTTDEPKNGHNVAWAKSYGAARIVYLQLGHDHQAYENANYRRLVKQAIQWVARRNTP
jgi:uncharacterized protein